MTIRRRAFGPTSAAALSDKRGSVLGVVHAAYRKQSDDADGIIDSSVVVSPAGMRWSRAVQ